MVGHLVDGLGVTEAAEREGIWRQRIWDWMRRDPEFQRMLEDAGLLLAEALVDEAVASALARARALTPKAIERIERGLAITHVTKAMSVPGGRDEGGRIELVDVPDDRAAAEIALKFLRHIQEFQPRQEVEVSGLEARLAAIGDSPSD